MEGERESWERHLGRGRRGGGGGQRGEKGGG